jgi:N6-adenosine-specific RNA methylase IME4
MTGVVALPRGELRRLGLRGQLSLTGWQLPDDMGEDEWLRAGGVLAKIERGVGWWLGDWWAFGEKRYGYRKAMVEASDWAGPSFQTCVDCGTVARRFESTRRHVLLSFKHHREVAALDPVAADRLLDWCEEPLRAGEKEPRSARHLRAAVMDYNAAGRVRQIGEQLALFPPGGERYAVLYADPPWQYENPPIGASNRAIENHYPTMLLEQICALPIDNLAADNAILYLWATAPKLAECFTVLEAWRFIYRTNFVWVKDKIGMGYHARSQHELLLVAKRGELPPPPLASRNSSVIFADRVEHSVKPIEVYEMIERFYPALPKIELFARNRRRGWDAHGNQLPETGAAA